MSISAAAFDDWVEELADGQRPSMRQVAKMSHLSSGYLSVARARGSFPADVVLGVAVNYGAHPVEELARFAGYQELWPQPDYPLQEVLFLVPVLDLMTELLWRGDHPGVDRPGGSRMAADALSRWSDLAFAGSSRVAVARGVGINRASMSTQLENGKMPIERILALSSYLRVHPGSGLVAGGHMDIEHLGWSIPQLLSKATAPQIFAELETAQKHVEEAFRMLVVVDEMHRKLG